MKCAMLLAFTLVASAAAEDRWLRLRSQNFEVLTNAGASTGRETLRRFEQIRQVFRTRTERPDLSPLPVRIFVFRPAQDFRRFQVHPHAAGYYQPGVSRDYIAMQASGADIYRIVFHEYVHLVLRHAGMPVPVWFNEGAAELYSTATFKADEVRIGGLIPAHIATLRVETMLDIPTLMEVDRNSEYYNEQDKTGIFYAQSWALAHMLNFSSGYQPGLANFMRMLLAGEPHRDAFRRAFGKSESAVLADLRDYVSRNRFLGLKLRAAKLANLHRITAEPLSSAEAHLALADLLLAIRKPEEAETIYRALAASSPDSPDLEAALAGLALQRNNDDDALAHFRRSIELGTQSGRVHYDYSVLLREKQGPADEVLRGLETAVRLDPALFDAHHLLGYLHLRAKRYSPAVASLKRAAELQPMRAAVWEYLALAYHYSGDRERARAAAQNARSAAATPEEIAQMEAVVELVEREPESVVDARPPATGLIESLSNNPPAEARSGELLGLKGDARVEGSLTQIDCLGERARLHIVAGGRKMHLLVRDPSWVVMRNAGASNFAFQCGPSEPRLVAIDYLTVPERTCGTLGDVTSIEFR